ncbi:MAG: PAS domain S-box protein [Betaproteobacteria bacterium]|nr:PAS domain S-box protein [Betaproteobacteria bacterium]
MPGFGRHALEGLMSILEDLCQESDQAAHGATLLRRAARPTIRKKFLLLFALLTLIVMGNVLVIQSSFSRLQGTATLINQTGSLRWISQSIQLDTLRLLQGLDPDRTAIDEKLRRLDEVLSALDSDGRMPHHEIKTQPPHLQQAVDSIWKHSINYRQRINSILFSASSQKNIQNELNQLYQNGQAILEMADAVTTTLASNAAQIETEAMRNLYRLAVLDLAILVFSLMVIRYQVVLPLRRLVLASRSFAKGQYEERVGFRSRDEIGEVALAFDQMADTIQRDMERIERDVVQLEVTGQSLRKMSQAIESSPAMVLITDADGVIEYINPKFTETTGYAPEEVLGNKPGMLKSGHTPSATYRNLWTTIRAGAEWRGELLNKKKNGDLFWEDTRISSLRDEQGRITHFISVKEDITERKIAADRIVKLNASLEQRVAERTRQLTASNKELEAFSYSISHDLRAPLRGINGFAHLMEEECQGCSKAATLDHLKRIRKASLHMGELIDDMLELSRVARCEVKMDSVRISDIANVLMMELTEAEPERRVDIRVEENLVVRGDAVLLHSALQNLLGNAWKFTSRRDRASIHFGCREENGERTFYVKDNGAGFEMRYADKLFSAFQRLHRPEDFEGTGIGLATVQRIIHLHGGRIWAESRIDAGSTFFFTLPDESAGNGL